MNQNRPYGTTAGIILAVFFLQAAIIPCSTPAQGMASQELEHPGTLNASKILDPKIRKGPHHEVAEAVYNDGLLNHYEVQSPFGEFRISGNSALRVLIHELDAIAAMKQVETDDTAIASLKESGEKTVTGLKNMFSDPEKTFDNAAEGVRGLFNRAKGTVGKRQITSQEDSRLEQLVGLTKAKGQIATSYGVSMYTSNTVLQDELDRLARADYVGGLGVGVATSFVPGLGGIVLTTSGTARLLNEAINTTPASELWLQNKNSLLKMGMNEDTVELFLNNPAFNPARHTLIVAALKSMDGVENLELFIKVALQANDPVTARVITETAILTGGYHTRVAPLKTIVPLARLTMAETGEGKRVVLLPTDHIIWSERVSQAVNPLVDTGKSFEIWTTGTLSTIAEDQFGKLGWAVHQSAGKQLLPAPEQDQK